MRILITGGAGFIGSNLAIALKLNFPAAEVVCMDNLYRRGSELNLPRLKAEGVQFHRGDVRKPSAFPLGPFDFLVECSAEPSVLAGIDHAPDYLIQSNLMGAYYCLKKRAFGGVASYFFLPVVFILSNDCKPTHGGKRQPVSVGRIKERWGLPPGASASSWT